MQSRCISNITRIAVALTVSLMLAFMPFTVNLQKYRITLERNEAHAIAPVFAGAAAFLGEMATAAGFATTGEFVATVAGATAVGTGMCIATDAGVRYGSEASQNLNNLVDAADYPAWDTLSSSDQQSWGSRENYDSAKLNSLMAAYGLGDAYDRYQSAWGSGGAGNFSFSSQEQSSLEQLGQIGSNWASGISNTFSDIRGLLANDYEQIINNYYGVQDYFEFNGTLVSGYPSSLKTHIYVTHGNYADVIFTYRNNQYHYSCKTDRDVYFMLVIVPETYSTSVMITAYDKQSFNYGSVTGTTSTTPPNPSNASSSRSSDLGTYYVGGFTATVLRDYSLTSSNMQYNSDTSTSWSKWEGAIPYILYGDQIGEMGALTPTVEQYPNVNEIDPDTPIYFPETGIYEDIPWEEFLTHNEVVEEDLTGIIALLRHIDSDLHALDIPGAPNLQPIINYLQHIDGDLHQLNFTSTGELKVVDIPVWTTLDNIYTRLGQILSVLNSMNDVADAPDIIGDFDFDELENKVPDLLETISDLAPFGSILLLSEMYSIMANYTQIESPELVFPFDFGGFDDQNHELIIDLSWLDDIKPLINFFCIAMLVIAIANATIRIVEIEAAS